MNLQDQTSRRYRPCLHRRRGLVVVALGLRRVLGALELLHVDVVVVEEEDNHRVVEAGFHRVVEAEVVLSSMALTALN